MVALSLPWCHWTLTKYLASILTTMPHTLDSVLVIEGLRLARRHHIFRILRSIVPMETETRSRKKGEALRRKTKSYVCFAPRRFPKTSGSAGGVGDPTVKAKPDTMLPLFQDRPTNFRRCLAASAARFLQNGSGVCPGARRYQCLSKSNSQ